MTARAFAVILLLAFTGVAMAQTQPQSATGIEGVIRVGPVVPGPVREGMASSAPLSNAAFTVSSQDRPVTSFTTDAEGRFRVFLAPGHYRFSVNQKVGIRACGPFDVDVIEGKMLAVQWECDTGMR